MSGILTAIWRWCHCETHSLSRNQRQVNFRTIIVRVTLVKPLPILLLLLPLAVGLTGGCEKEDKIASYTAPKEPPEPKRERPWTLPQGWREVATTDQMQAARFLLNDRQPPLAMTLT